MAILECHETSDKGLSHGYYGGGQKMSGMTNWAFKRENKYQGAHNGNAMGYSPIRCPPKYGMSESYGMNESYSEYERSNVMSKPQVHGSGYGHDLGYGGHGGFGGHSSHGMSHQSQSFNHGGPIRHQSPGYGYGHGPNHGNSGSYERTEAHAYNEYENSGYGNYSGKHSGMANEFLKTQGHPGKMGYQSRTESSLYKKSEARYSNGGSGYGGGYYTGGGGMDCHPNMGQFGRMKMESRSLSGNSSCSDDSESDDDGYGRKEVWASKAL